MTEFRYRAYISYSHKDEAMAAWIQRALESYRVPRGLVDRQTRAGKVPARIRPVFRDREDLSSATDLGDTVQKALDASENLIVICSPDAVASRWVNEEIRNFASAGRAERVFCIIVGGDSASDGSVANCFPAALAEIGLREPLAADVRSWADGKYVAKLKLIAGLLGLRLDELRQRDLKRKRKRQLGIGVAVMAALVLTAMTVFSRISERQERERTEQLASFIVDLGERLQTDVDLETRALIGQQAAGYFESLNPDRLSAETGKNVALAIRQLGLVSEDLGRLDEALASFTQSRDLLSSLVVKYPDNPDLLFELGNAEFYIGNVHNLEGRYDLALAAMQQYQLLTQQLVDSDPDNPDWIMELAYSYNNLAAVHLDSGRRINAVTLEQVAEATRLMEKVLVLRPEDEAVIDGYSTILAWAADAQFQACNPVEAMELRKRGVALMETTQKANTGNNRLKLQLAYAVSGVARLQLRMGQLVMAEKKLKLVISTLQQLLAADSKNVGYRNELLYRQITLAGLRLETGELEAARSLLIEIAAKLRPADEISNHSGEAQLHHLEFLLANAEAEHQMGSINAANTYLKSAVKILSGSVSPDAEDIMETYWRVKTNYQWWALNGESNVEISKNLPELVLDSSYEYRSCVGAESAARMYIINGDQAAAAKEVEYLQSKGYAEPNFMRFCKKHELCSG